MNQIRIAHIVKDLGYAGKEAGIVKISSRMDPSRFAVDIIVLGKIFREKQVETGAFRTIAVQKRPGNDPRVVFKLADIFRRNRYDIVYTHSWNTLVEGFLAARIAGVPAIIHGEHGTFERSWLKDRLQAALWSRFDAVTVVAGELKQRMVGLFGYRRQNIKVIHNGIDSTVFHHSAVWREHFRRAHNLQSSFVVGTVGRFHPVKDQQTLLRGFARFAGSDACADARLVLMGPATHRPTYERCTALAAELGIVDKVLFLPPTPEVAPVLNGFDVFVLPSLSEGCSNVILEAMACGVAVVATRTGGNPELVVHNTTGLLFDIEDADALAEMLKQLYENADRRRQLAAAGLSTVQRRFTLERTVENYQNLYDWLYGLKCRNGHGATEEKVVFAARQLGN